MGVSVLVLFGLDFEHVLPCFGDGWFYFLPVEASNHGCLFSRTIL